MLVYILNILFADFRSQRRFHPRSFFWGVFVAFIVFLANNQRYHGEILLFDGHRTATDLLVVDAILEKEIIDMYLAYIKSEARAEALHCQNSGSTEPECDH